MKKTLFHIDSEFVGNNISRNNLILLPPNPLFFENNNTIVSVELGEDQVKLFDVGDKINFFGIKSTVSILELPFSVKKNSKYVRIKHHAHSIYSEDNIKADTIKPINFVDAIVGVYDRDTTINDKLQFYTTTNTTYSIDILSTDLTIDPTILNIPINFINGNHKVYPIFYKNAYGKIMLDPNNFLIELLKPANINLSDFGKQILITFNNLCGIPIDHLVQNDFLITGRLDHSITVDTKLPAAFDKFTYNQNNQGGGNSVYISVTHNNSNNSSNHSSSNKYSISSYKIKLSKVFDRVISTQMLSINFPNKIYNINTSSNIFYWRNLDSGNDMMHTITLANGFYNYNNLAKELEKQIKKIPRIFISKPTQLVQSYDSLGNYNYNLAKIKFNTSTNTSTFIFYKKKILTDTFDNYCLRIPDKYIDIDTSTNVSNINNLDVDNLYFVTDNKLSQNARQLYKIISATDNKLIAEINFTKKLVINYYDYDNKTYVSYSLNMPHINTFDVDYDNDTGATIVTSISHNLSIGDLFLTDKVDIVANSSVFSNGQPILYTVTKIIDSDRLTIEPNSNLIFNSTLYNSNDSIQPNTVEIIGVHSVSDNIGAQYKIIVSHKNHELEIGDKIKISKSLDVNGISYSCINGWFKIKEIIDEDNYVVYIKNYVRSQLQLYSHSNKQINQIKIKYPQHSQLLFTNSNNIKKLLGYNKTNYTNYSKKIINKDYDYADLNINTIGYYYVQIPELSDDAVEIKNNIKIPGVYALINTSNNYDVNNVLMSHTISRKKIYTAPLRNISELTVNLISPSNNKVDFGTNPHSFCLEFEELNS
jgi:hypothetical protein